MSEKEIESLYNEHFEEMTGADNKKNDNLSPSDY